jgi:integrase
MEVQSEQATEIELANTMLQEKNFIIEQDRAALARERERSERLLLSVLPAPIAERMKAGKAHRVPLSDEVIKLLSALPRMVNEQLVFSGRKEKTPLSDMSLTMLLRRHVPGITAHGFRSTFRDWAAETTNYPNEVCEMALAHAVGGSVEAAYRRSDLYAKRAALMKDWANYATRTDKSK